MTAPSSALWRSIRAIAASTSSLGEASPDFTSSAQAVASTAGSIFAPDPIPESAPLDRTDDAMWDRILELDVTAAFRVTRALAPAMIEAGFGRILNVASNAGVSGYAYSTAYCAAKHAMVGMTRALAIDLARSGVTVQALCPGWVETQMAEEAVTRIAAKTGRTLEEARTSLAAMSPQRRMITPDEVAHAALSLCAHGARGIHGQTIVIDGGAVLK